MGHPALVGVEPPGLTVLFCRREADRSGPTWARRLARLTKLEFVVSNGAAGIAAGVGAVAAARPKEAPKLVQGLDAFHILREGGQALAAICRKPEAAFAAAEKAEAATAQAKRRGIDARPTAQASQRAWELPRALLAEADRKPQA